MPKCQISSKFGKQFYMNKGEESYSDVTAFCIDIFNIRFVLEEWKQFISKMQNSFGLVFLNFNTKMDQNL